MSVSIVATEKLIKDGRVTVFSKHCLHRIRRVSHCEYKQVLICHFICIVMRLGCLQTFFKILKVNSSYAKCFISKNIVDSNFGVCKNLHEKIFIHKPYASDGIFNSAHFQQIMLQFKLSLIVFHVMNRCK